MGRGRLRRGCSLEVIFEEDPDFCSHLDSLDGGVAIRFGIKEPDDTISLDSLLEVEEYQVRFQDPADAEQVFKSLDGFIDVRNMDSCMVEWDEFSMDSNSSKTGEESRNETADHNAFLDSNDLTSPNNAEKPPSGRRSRVSRRQIIQATWLGYSSSSDESMTNNDLDENDNTISTANANLAPTKPPRRRSPSSRHHKSKHNKDAEQKREESHSSPQGGASSDMVSTSSSSLPMIKVESPDNSISNNDSLNLVTSVEDFLESDRKEGSIVGLKTPIQLHLRSSPNTSMEGALLHGGAMALPPYAMFGRTDTLDVLEKDTLDSYISTMTDDTDTNAYTFADPFDDTHSVASTSYESSDSTSSTESNGSVCTVNSFSTKAGKPKSNSNNEGKNCNSDGGESPTANDIENRVSGSGSGSSASKYKSNLKVELVSQLNKSQEENLHKGSTGSAPGSTLVNPSNLYSDNSHLNLQSTCSITASAVGGSSITSPSHHQQRTQHQPLLLSHQQQQSLSDSERQACSGEVKRVRALFELRNHSRSSLNGSDSCGNSSNGSTCPSSPESISRSVSSRNGGDTSPCGSASGRVGLYSKNGRRSRESPQNQRGSKAASPSKLLRSTYTTSNTTNLPHNSVGGNNSNIHVGGSGSPVAGSHQSSYDYVDILVNDNVVIEDSPDIYQTTRSRKQANFDRDSIPSPPTHNKRPVTLLNLSPRDGGSSPGGGFLRRSQSMGTGISSIGGSSPSILKQSSSSKTNILAEELPAPDTVKNVRNVFENMLKMKENSHGSENSVDMNTPSTGFSGSFSIVKKSLSYIKSNPTSKIYRSESMRDDFPSMGRRFGKPVLMSETNSPVHSPSSYHPTIVASPSSSSSVANVERTSTTTTATTDSCLGSTSIKWRCNTVASTAGDVVDASSSRRGGTARRSNSVSPMNKNPIERKMSEPAKFSPKINTGLSPCSVPSMLRTSCQVPLTEEDPSFSSNVSNSAAEEYRSRKYVHPEVLNKIRSAGTTTTYFGGKIVAKTIKSRNIPVSRRHTFDFQDYVGISGDGTSFTNNYDSYSSSNYYKDDETGENKRRGSASGGNGGGSGCGATSSGGIGRSGSSRPALEIPLKSSSSSFYASHNTTISGALDSIFASGVGGLLTFASKPIDTTPRIISVLHKSPPGSHTGSPVKSCSPVSSVIEEGRNSPEGCEATNEKTVVEQDGNNNNLPRKVDSSPRNRTEENEGFNKKFSQITEGAWF